MFYSQLTEGFFDKKKPVEAKLNKGDVDWYLDNYEVAMSIKQGKTKGFNTEAMDIIGLVLAGFTPADLKKVYDCKISGTDTSDLYEYMEGAEGKKAIATMVKFKMKVISADGGGNHYLLGTDNKIYDWDHEMHPQLREGKTIEALKAYYTGSFADAKIINFILGELAKGSSPKEILNHENVQQ